MLDPFIGQIMIIANSFAPKGWALCNGQMLPIAQYTALFSILGTTYGGNGQTTFQLPDLQARFPLHAGLGAGLTPRSLGEYGGHATHSLTIAELPPHAHQLHATSAAATHQSANGALLAKVNAPLPPYHDSASLAPRPSGALGIAGGGQPHNNLQPYLALNFVIALQGVYPTRI